MVDMLVAMAVAKPKDQREIHRRLEEQETDMIEKVAADIWTQGGRGQVGHPAVHVGSKIRSLKINKNRFRTSPET